ncbi:YhcN/YlaJ family sporulation lipoprotein [Bacillus xiapuensis]|uniref:YhcN/YlaJ family sporulation lipoprotein n=1 Tax=Bacillus xiapuensis TaxID=2014075 RepID=A0ABU6NB38_9BACI|nr:YhcN/YlaJ family sporulation lipoprotein [Bacillus xiapuensis]
MIYIQRLVILSCLCLLASCSGNQKVKDSQLALMKTTNPNPIMTDRDKNTNRVQEIEKAVSSFPEIYDAAVIKGKKETLVVYKVKHSHRFKMKKIEKNLTKFLNKRFPKENITVSSDYKIFLEAVRLNERIESKKFSDQKAEKRLGEIIKMTEEMT